MTPTVSVVIPTFNRSKLLLNAIDSVLAQTYKDYEIIVIDDGSTDDTRESLRPYMARIRYFYQENRGESAARNKGIQVARGKWLSLLDSDDVWLPTKLERQFEAITTMDNEVGACFTDCSYVGNPDLTLSAFEQAGLNLGTRSALLDDPGRCVLAKYPALYVQSLLVLRSLLEELKGFDEDMVVVGDTDLLFRLSFKTRFCCVSAPLVKIDRTPSRQLGLIELLSQRNDRIFASREHMHRKWLALPELVDCATRQYIHDKLRRLYYDWIISKLYKFRIADALLKIEQVREMGDTYTLIFSTLGFRAARKLSRALRSGIPGE